MDLRCILSSYSKKKRRKQQALENQQQQAVQPWISMKTGRRVILVASLAMAILTAVQVIPEKGVPEGIFWGLVFGAMIWVIFEGYTFLHRFLRRIR